MIQPVSFTGKKVSINSRAFYDKHPDLMPRNLYLYSGKTVSRKEIDEGIENVGAPLHVRVINWFKNKINNLFNRDNK